jgi:hypothetical protein
MQFLSEMFPLICLAWLTWGWINWAVMCHDEARQVRWISNAVEYNRKHFWAFICMLVLFMVLGPVTQVIRWVQGVNTYKVT